MIAPPQFVRRRLTGGLMALVASIATVATGQEKPAATYDDWRLLEPAQEMLDYKARLRDGSFDETSKNFLLKTALPQLGLPKNQPTIDRVRRRMREVLCGDQTIDPKVASAAMQEVTTFMIAAARNPKADDVLRVNAVLLMGELRGTGAKPWTPAAAPLAAVLGDDSLPPAVRIAAAAGLARHVDAEPEARSADVGPALVALVKSPLKGVDPAAAGWLRSRALAMLARMGPAAPAGTVAAAAGVLRDAAQPLDVRVRAAATVGACAKAPGDTDVAAALAATRDLATAGLESTRAEIERREQAERLSGASAAKPPRDGMDATEGGTPHLFRRAAWRLATLADAVAPATGTGGLAGVAGAQATAAADVAKALREGAGLLDAQPDAASLTGAIEALAAVAGAAPPAAPATNPTAPANADPKPPASAPASDGVPFGG